MGNSYRRSDKWHQPAYLDAIPVKDRTYFDRWDELQRPGIHDRSRGGRWTGSRSRSATFRSGCSPRRSGLACDTDPPKLPH